MSDLTLCLTRGMMSEAAPQTRNGAAGAAVHISLASVFACHCCSRKCKWEALCAWAEHERTQSGEEPLLWLDSACVKSDLPVDRSLAMLPLYLAGTQRMVVLLGSTFLERLW